MSTWPNSPSTWPLLDYIQGQGGLCQELSPFGGSWVGLESSSLSSQQLDFVFPLHEPCTLISVLLLPGRMKMYFS